MTLSFMAPLRRPPKSTRTGISDPRSQPLLSRLKFKIFLDGKKFCIYSHISGEILDNFCQIFFVLTFICRSQNVLIKSIFLTWFHSNISLKILFKGQNFGQLWQHFFKFNSTYTWVSFYVSIYSKSYLSFINP